MGRVTADEIVTQQHLRYFYQLNGASPYNDMVYAGADGQYMNIESNDDPVSGGISPINVQNPQQTKSYRRAGREISAPEFPTATVNFLQFHGGIPRQQYNMKNCITTFYATAGNCKDPSDFLSGWNDYVKVLSNGEVSPKTDGGGAFDGDSMVQDDLDFVFAKAYYTGSLSFGEKAASSLTTEVIDITYGNRVQCGGCGPDDDGTKLIYAITDGVSGSAGSLPTVYYSTDGGSTWTASPVSTALATDTPVSIDVVGQRLMVTIQNGTTGGYHLADINRLTGAPGSWSALITTGFNSGNQANDVYVANPREVYFCGDGGYIYKATNILQGVSIIDEANTTTNNLERIDGFEALIVAVGASATVVFSENRGSTWSVTTNSPGAGTLQAVEVMGDFLWWVGDNAGAVYYSNTQGESAWTAQTLPTTAAGTVTAIQDINFATDEMGYIVGSTADPTAVLFTTMNGGSDWDKASGSDSNTGRVSGTMPTSDRYNRIAYPVVDNFSVASSNIALGGLAGDGTDGIILLGIAPVKG